MNRREFLKRMGLAGLVIATPKLIFDMGKNSRRGMPMLNPAWESAQYEEILIHGKFPFGITAPKNERADLLKEFDPWASVPLLYPRRFEKNPNGVMVEVPVWV